MKFIGIDLAWTYKNESGVCIINDKGKVEYLDASNFSDEDLIEMIKTYNDEQLFIGIDAPLIIKNVNGSRGAESELMKERINGYSLKLFNANQTFMKKTYGHMRGVTLANLIVSEIPETILCDTLPKEWNGVLETFPTGVICGLFPEIYPVNYKLHRKTPFDQTRDEMIRLLERLKLIETFEKKITGLLNYLDIDQVSLNKKHYKNLEDKIDAFLCAYGLYAVMNGNADLKSFGDLDKGFIAIPVLDQNKVKALKEVYRIK